MKKKLGALLLVLASLALSAACASSGSTAAPKQPEPREELWAEAPPSQVPSQPANAVDVPTEAAQ